MTTWSTGNPTLAPLDGEEYWQLLLVWASRITRNSPSFARHLRERHLLCAAALDNALQALEDGTLVRGGRNGL